MECRTRGNLPSRSYLLAWSIFCFSKRVATGLQGDAVTASSLSGAQLICRRPYNDCVQEHIDPRRAWNNQENVSIYAYNFTPPRRRNRTTLVGFRHDICTSSCLRSVSLTQWVVKLVSILYTRRAAVRQQRTRMSSIRSVRKPLLQRTLVSYHSSDSRPTVRCVQPLLERNNCTVVVYMVVRPRKKEISDENRKNFKQSYPLYLSGWTFALWLGSTRQECG